MRDEAPMARDGAEGSGRGSLLTQALARANLVVAWERVKANRGGAGVDGLSIDPIFSDHSYGFRRDAVRMTQCSVHGSTCRTATGPWSMWIWRGEVAPLI